MLKVKPRFKAAPPRHFVREWRKHRGLTAHRLAERSGVTHQTMSQLEDGAMDYTQGLLEALARALNSTPAELIGQNPWRN